MYQLCYFIALKVQLGICVCVCVCVCMLVCVRVYVYIYKYLCENNRAMYAQKYITLRYTVIIQYAQMRYTCIT